MIPLQTVVRMAPSVCRHFVQLRGGTKTTNVVSTPASVKISFAEKLAHGVLIACGVCTYSMWVLTHLRDYRERKQLGIRIIAQLK
jgi:hypothetical protein